ncbi:choice-of-anchor L domain-containing protein [Winogradskyella sp.]|nr:choice-of-anchor L domain-containing protein [Winogradskyella sp.]
MKKIFSFLALFIVVVGYAQDLSMQNGTFNRCAPDRFFDSGGEFGPYDNDENLVTTICPQNTGEFIILDFTAFATQQGLNGDEMNIYDGDDLTAPLLGSFIGPVGAFTVSASAANTSGCLTIEFISTNTGNTDGWQADILCATPCQTIFPSINSTIPVANGSGVVTILPGDTVDFFSSATFTVDGTNATYDWDFGDTNTATGTDVSNTFATEGTYIVTLTVGDDNPQGCSVSTTITVFVLGPNVVVDQVTFTTEELIEDVLVNSPCATVTNIVSSTGTNFGTNEPNGIGYFTSNGVDFPFADGILLTSGDASEARGPNNNAMSAGSGAWPGDAELDVAVGINSNNASFIQFDFTPLADSISFEFLMASEEYDMGGFECQFSDAFAFLLTDAMGNTTNLAVLPGTNTPILVTNIHPDNGVCGAVNEQYFGEYTAGNAPPISFDGRTAVFTAQSAVVPGEQYTIKLVVADATDTQLDSGVFLKAGSFDLGGDLGDDITIAAGNAECGGTAVVLDTSVDTATHVWYLDGVVIPGETTSTLTVNTAGTYSVDVVFTGVCQSSDSVVIEFKPNPIVANQPQNLIDCDAGGGFVEFDLTVNDDDILGAQDPADFVVSYHLTEQDAIDNVGPLPDNYTNTVNPQVLWARIAENTQECFATTSSFTLSASPPPTINPVLDLTLCDYNSNDGFEEFDLGAQTIAVLGAQLPADFEVTYHLSFADADTDTGALPLNYTNTVNPQPIFIRIESIADSNCYNVTPLAAFSLTVIPRALATMPDDMVVCDDASNDGLATFDLASQEAAILDGQDPAVYVVSFHGSQADADLNAAPLGTPYTNTTPNLEEVFVRVEDPLNPDCFGTTSFNLVINPLPAVVPVPPLSVCDDDTDGFALFDMSTMIPDLLNGQVGVNVTFHETFAEADAGTGALADGYTNTGVPNQILFVRLDNATTACYSITTLTIEVQQNPIANPTTPLQVCDDNADGLGVFDLSLRDAEVVGAQAGMVVSYYATPADAVLGINPLPTNYTNTFPSAQEIYVRIENVATGCSATTTLQLIVNPLPLTIAVSPFELCDDNTTGDEIEVFDLTTKDAEILNGQVNVTVAYYENLADATAGINAIIVPFTNTINPQPLVAVLTNTNTGCVSSVDFNLVVNPLPIPVAPTVLEVCDDGVPDGFTAIDLSLKNIEISANNPDYAVSYYLTQADAIAELNPLPIPYTNIANPQTIFVRVEDITTGCFATTVLDLDVQQAPVANVPQALRYCDPDNDGFGVFDLTIVDNEITGGVGGLSVTYHETPTDAALGVVAIDTSIDYNNIVAFNQFLYARVESATIATDCATIVPLELIVEDTPQLVAPTPLEICDDISADGFAQFDLTTKDAEILNGQDPAQYIVSYYETEDFANAATNAIANPTAYTNTDDFSQMLWVRVDDTMTLAGCYKLTTLELIVNPLPVLITPAPLELCDVTNPGDEQEAFTLELANEDILNNQTGITLSYYETQLDADNATNPIFSPYVNTVNAQTIFVRAVNDNTGCINTVTVTLRVNPIPSPAPNPTELRVCDDDNDGFGEFDLELRTLEITNGEPDIVITYHETPTDAEMGDNAIVGLYTNIVPNTQLIYVRAENTVTGCYSLTQNSLQLIVDAAPQIPTVIEDYMICDADDNGITQFDLTTKDDEIYNGADPVGFTLTYHLNAADAATGNNPIINTGNYTNVSNPQTIYVRVVSDANGCEDTGAFEIRVELPPAVVQPTPLNICDDLGEVPGDEITVFDLTLKDPEITAGNASWSVAYYETAADAQAQVNAIPDPTAYTNTSIGGLAANPQTLYVVVTDTDTGCVDFTTLTIRVLPNPTPTLSDQIADLELCDDFNTGDGFEVFNLLGLEGFNTQEDFILNGELGVTASYYETAEDADLGVNAIADPENYTNIESPEQEIYVRVTNNLTDCYALVDFTIRVNPLPSVIAVTDFLDCELNTDGIGSFDLTTKDAEVLNGQDATQFVVTYHETLADAQTQMNALVSPYTNLASPQQIFVAITNTVTGCAIATQSFNLEVQEAAEANSDMDPIVYEACDDTMETDGDPSNDTVQFDLATQDPEVLDGQNPLDYQVSYFATLADATLNVSQLPNLYENVTNTQVIYARVDNNILVVIPIALDLVALGTTGLDLDGDGVIDTYDTDADGIFDLVDVDGDGLSDAIDADADGIIEFVDIDGDGLGDPVDLDNDGDFDNQSDSSACFAIAEITLQVNPLPEFNLEATYTLCLGTNGTEILDPLVIDTALSDADYSFEWLFNGTVMLGETGSSLMPTQGGVYQVIVTDTVTGCVNDLDVGVTEVFESEPPSLDVNVLTQAFAENHVIEAVATGLGVYEYSLDGGPWQDSGIFSNVSPGEHEITARDKNGCGIVSEFVFVLDYPLYFTPNGDNNHDTWNIENIGSSAKIYIFDRYGKLIKQLNPTGQGWDGTFNGNMMPTSDYWFTVEYDEPLTNQRKQFKAHFTLKR